MLCLGSITEYKFKVILLDDREIKFTYKVRGCNNRIQSKLNSKNDF